MQVYPDEHSVRIVPMAIMSTQDGRGARPDAGGSLSCLVTSPLAGRFCAWRGASARRYVATLFKLDRTQKDLGLPIFDAFVLISVASTGGTRCIVDVVAVGRASERRSAIARALAHGVEEWHVHLPGAPRSSLDAIADDLRARHVGRGSEARCA